MRERTLKARIKKEQVRTIDLITSRSERPKGAFWLSFADDDGFRGAVIVHSEDFGAAVMECNLRGINPHGECQGMAIPEHVIIPEYWKYRMLTREECEQFDKEMQSATVSDT